LVGLGGLWDGLLLELLMFILCCFTLMFQFEVYKAYYFYKSSVKRSRRGPTFNNIIVTSWRSALLVEETCVPGYHIMLYRLAWAGFELTTLVVIGFLWDGLLLELLMFVLCCFTLMFQLLFYYSRYIKLITSTKVP
jgi:hypothetical protein